MTAAGNPLSSAVTSTEPPPTALGTANKPLDFSADSVPQRIVLSPDQRSHCLEALKALKEKRCHSPDKIASEFSALQENRLKASEMKSRCLVALDSTNISKNRYTDVIPFDNNRVVLDPCKDYRPSAKGYINASFIEISEGVSRFVATQGPLAHTFEDFWEMIIQQRCPVIVMLTRLVDNYKMVKCGDYFQAEDGPRTFGNICIVTKYITSDTSLVLRTLEVNYIEDQYLFCYDAIIDELEDLISDDNGEKSL